MDLLVIATAAMLASTLTLFCGFGLGTLLMPVFALFFPVSVAVAATALVHVANNIFKFALMARQADWRVVTRFGAPAAVAAIAGASLLVVVDRLPPWFGYSMGGATLEVTPVKATIGVLIIAFAMLELSRRFQALAFPASWLPFGGLLSGFFGGLSGNQGALRSAFLIKANLSKEAFVATGAVSAVIVDAVRLLVYGRDLLFRDMETVRSLALPVTVGILCALAGSLIGRRLLKKVTLPFLQRVVAVGLLAIGLGLAAGWL